MSSLPTIYQIAFQEGLRNFDELPKVLAQIRELEEKVARRPRLCAAPAPEREGRAA